MFRLISITKEVNVLVDNKSNEIQISQLSCIEKIFKQFYYDTITLLDCVLADSESDPEYSAITTYQRLEDVLCYEHLFKNSDALDVFAYLKEKNYSDVDIADFKRRIQEEAPLWKATKKTGDGSLC